MKCGNPSFSFFSLRPRRPSREHYYIMFWLAYTGGTSVCTLSILVISLTDTYDNRRAHRLMSRRQYSNNYCGRIPLELHYLLEYLTARTSFIISSSLMSGFSGRLSTKWSRSCSRCAGFAIVAIIFACLLLPAKLRISEQNTKENHVFLLIFERKQLRGLAQSADILLNYPNICRCFSISKSNCGKWGSGWCPHGVAQSACHDIVAILMLKPEKSRRGLTTVLAFKSNFQIGKPVQNLYTNKKRKLQPFLSQAWNLPTTYNGETCAVNAVSMYVVCSSISLSRFQFG